MSKIIFLDIDGVVNCSRTTVIHDHVFGIDPYMSLLVTRICEATGAEIVLSSSWRLREDNRKYVEDHVFPKPIDVTPDQGGMSTRNTEIKTWLAAHPEVTKYAILDDNNVFHEDQQPNFFKTTWERGLTDEIANKVIEHLGPLTKE